MKHFLLIIGLITLSVFSATAQLKLGGKDSGFLTGSVESNMNYYLEDKDMGITSVDDNFAINTYLNIGYKWHNISGGLNYELYQPPLLGYNTQLKGNKLIGGFLEYRTSKYLVNLGSVIEQFGSGLLFKAYEERSLGLNTSLMGANFRAEPISGIILKGVVGKPRKFLDYSDTWVYGLDGDFNINSIFGLSDNVQFTFGGGWILRDWKGEDVNVDTIFSSVVRAYSARLSLSTLHYRMDAEYVTKSTAFVDARPFVPKKGKALLINLGADYDIFSASVNLRCIQNMSFRSDDYFKDRGDDVVMLNYIPSLTKQYKYSLASMYPYIMDSDGEIGGQLEISGMLFSYSTNPLNLVLNAALYKEVQHDDNFFEFGGKFKYQEIGLEADKYLSDQLKLTMNYVYQKMVKPTYLSTSTLKYKSFHTVVGDVLYTINDKHSIRAEVQHMWTNYSDNKRWFAGTLEYCLAPSLSFYVSDMINYVTKAEKALNYYSAGTSFSWKKLRVSLDYGRNTAGYKCAGGVCRQIPQYSGLNCAIIYSL